MRRKDGGLRSDYDYKIDEYILNIIFDKKRINTDRIKTLINEKYGRKVGWITVKRHLDNLLKDKKIEIFYETEGKEKKIRIYKLNE